MIERTELAAIFKRLQRASVELRFERAAKKLPLGASKFGGWPSLPKGFEWPFYVAERPGANAEPTRRPLTFLMQLNLEEVAPYDGEKRLPKSGWLYFFFERVDGYCNCVEPEGKGGARVFYFDGPLDATVETAPPPEFDALEEEDGEIWGPDDEAAITFENGVSVPDFEEAEEYGGEFALELDEADADAYRELRGAFTGEGANVGRRLFGFPDLIQTPMRVDCERLAAGISWEEFCDSSASERAKIEENAKNWTLLCQLGTDDDGGVELYWGGDCGALYFYIREDDLRRGDFDRVWAFWQMG
ncbi:MAG: DUF1963 domain-containing protein [Thermoguttaceae bacterium]|nr:DUF1963 domain-containing protein [Thermoguttaceae bacterium]